VGVLLTTLGVHDLLQTHHSILRSYPIIGHLRFLLEDMRAEIRQYFIESDTEGVPFSRNKRAIVYQRAKGDLDKRPFGTKLDVYATAFEWLNHSISPKVPNHEPFRITVGGPDCKKPYSASVLNISAMSFGALSANAILALNTGAKMGGFAHDTGEGGFSRYHAEPGGDIIWQVGSGYFGCHNPDGSFSSDRFRETVSAPQIKMVEIKLSQGAKPGHGGVLPGAKVTPEIAAARGIPVGEDCISPACHSAFTTPKEFLTFVQHLRDLSGGKPVGAKLCIGHQWEFMAICKAMLETGITPDFFVIDGSEGGTGAAPLEFVDHIGMPLRDALSFVHNTLIGLNLRDKIRLGASGKVASAFDMARLMALGADWCNAARGFMFSVGCIQAQSCHTGRCPTGVATQDPVRQRSLVVSEKAPRVFHFHHSTLETLSEVVAAVGLDHPSELRPQHITKRISQNEVKTYDQLYPMLSPGELLGQCEDPYFTYPWSLAQSHTFMPLSNVQN
jgi:glutamate synthase domain-containing protein 2